MEKVTKIIDRKGFAETYTVEECCEILDSQRVPIKGSERSAGEYPYYGANGIQDYVDDYIFDDELVLLAEDGGNFGSKTRPIAYRVSGKCWVNNHAHVLKPKSMIDVDYLCYSLMFYDTNGLVNGATRQKLTQATMRKMKIPKITLEEQLKIVEKLKKVQGVITKKRKQLEGLDILIKARFVEMFGDPVSNPFNYDKVRLSQIADIKIGPFGSLLHKEDYIENGHPLVNPSHIVDSKISVDNKLTISNEKYEYTGNSIALPTVTVTDAAGEIVSDQYYTVTFKNKTTGAVVTEIKDTGTYEVIVTFNTLYEGEVAKEITVVNNSGTTPADTTPGGTNNSGTTNVSNSDTTNKTDNDNSVTKPGKVKKVTTKVNKKKSVIIKWRKQKAVTGYQIRYSVNKKMKKAKIKTITKNNAKAVLKKLKPGKYFVQIRAYKVVNGKKVAGKWSSKKVVKVSK